MMPVERLQVPDFFEWNSSKASAGNRTDNSSADQEISVKKSRKKKRKLSEDNISKEQSTKVAKFHPSSPDYVELETAGECERLAVAFPSASKAWILYMTFYLKQSEVEKARNVAYKALKIIPFREQEEKFNVCVALLNLENLYGTEESLKEAFQQALLYCEPKRIHVHLAKLYIKFEKHEEAEQLLETMMQKFKDDVEIWIMCIDFYMKLGKPEEAHKLVDRSLLVLDKTFHADIMGKAARLECDYGNWEKGKSLFESIITKYPKRKDILSVYISLLRKSGDMSRAEQLSLLLEKKGS